MKYEDLTFEEREFVREGACDGCKGYFDLNCPFDCDIIEEEIDRMERIEKG